MALSALLLAVVVFQSPPEPMAVQPAAQQAALQEPAPQAPAPEPTQAPPEPMAVQPAAQEPAAQEAARPATEPVEGSIAAGLQAYKRRHFAKAEDLFRQAVEASPESAAAHFYLGYTIYKRTEPKRPFHPDKQKAAEQFARAFELDPAFRPRWK